MIALAAVLPNHTPSKPQTTPITTNLSAMKLKRANSPKEPASGSNPPAADPRLPAQLKGYTCRVEGHHRHREDLKYPVGKFMPSERQLKKLVVIRILSMFDLA
ncbi:hypothetical protein BC936DRAFT_146150 [Jimgerdemannia flammicorona]|uniref:Uncharacterized protein n=1 Tax=Jimgerdemannia flammicorona TaxID=994334 RepID=A0A433D8A7_9FUNG|nr:hypothetical protein BC936DRAFT_146150 [Jimgerdemannia flammicorona]